MLKLNASYSKKIPASEEFSSQSYHCAVEVELPDGLTREELGQRIHETFDLVRQSVEAELAGAGAGNSFRFPARGATRTGSRPQKRSRPASEKQLSYLQDIAARQGISPAELEADVTARFGVRSMAQLSREDASSMIDGFEGNPPDRQRGQAA